VSSHKTNKNPARSRAQGTRLQHPRFNCQLTTSKFAMKKAVSVCRTKRLVVASQKCHPDFCFRLLRGTRRIDRVHVRSYGSGWRRIAKATPCPLIRGLDHSTSRTLDFPLLTRSSRGMLAATSSSPSAFLFCKRMPRPPLSPPSTHTPFLPRRNEPSLARKPTYVPASPRSSSSVVPGAVTRSRRGSFLCPPKRMDDN